MATQPNDWRSPEQRAVADIFKRLAAGEKIDGWEYFPASTGLYGDSQYEVSEPATASFNGKAFLENGVEQRNEGIGTVLKDAAKLAAVMGAAYFGGLGLESLAAGGAGAGAAGAGSLTAGITPEAVAAFEAGLPGAAGGASALPAAGIGSLTAGMTPEVVAALEAGLPAATDVAATGLLTTPAVVPEAVGSLTAGITPEAVAAAENLLPGYAGAAGIGAPVTTAAAPYVMSSADKAAMLGNSGYGPGMTGLQTSVYDGILGATGSKTVADLASTAAGAGSSLKTWAAANPQLAKMAFSGATSLLSAAGGGGGGGGGGYQDSGYRPTISRGGWKAQVTPGAPGAPTGLLNNMRPVNLPGQGQANDGLWRYGLLGPGRG